MASTRAENVAVSATLRTSKSVCPSTFKLDSATIPLWKVAVLVTVAIATYNWSPFIPPTTSIRLLTSTREENVETPVTTSSSTSNWPSISKTPLISTVLLKVATPATTSSSKSVCPSTSIPLVPISNPVALTIPDVTSIPPAVTLTSSPNVETPVTLTLIRFPKKLTFWLEFIRSASFPLVWKEIVSLAGNLIFVFESPVWYIVSAISKLPDTVTVLLNVAAPATTTSSKSAWPSTSKPALISTAEANVETPETFKRSVSVRPVTSIPSAVVDTRSILL